MNRTKALIMTVGPLGQHSNGGKFAAKVETRVRFLHISERQRTVTLSLPAYCVL